MQLDLAKSDKMSSSNKTYIFLLLCSNCLKIIKGRKICPNPTKLYLTVTVFLLFAFFSFLSVFVEKLYFFFIVYWIVSSFSEGVLRTVIV